MAIINSQRKSVAILGLGQWGRNLFRNLKELDVLHSAADLDHATLSEFQHVHSDILFGKEPLEIIEDGQVRAVVISTPASSHYMLTKQALLAGKHVFVEKPLALALPGGLELSELTRNRGNILMVGHILHYHPDVKNLKELVAQRKSEGRRQWGQHLRLTKHPHSMS